MKFVIASIAALFTATAALAARSDILVPGGGAVYLPDSEIMVRLSAVQDVRCPSTVNCVWEGTIRVELELAVPGDAPEIIVLCNSCDDASRSAQYGRHTLTLVRLEPGRKVLDPLNRLAELRDYTVVLGVEWP